MMTRLIQSTLLQLRSCGAKSSTMKKHGLPLVCVSYVLPSLACSQRWRCVGSAQQQKWGLILPSSARVSQLTHQTVLGVRYPELVKATADGWKYSRYSMSPLKPRCREDSHRSFGDVPKSIMHAVSDIGALVEWLQANIEFGHDSANNLAVLHNQNRMVDDFGLSAWVTQSKRQVISRSVTSCAGMTAFTVVVAHTKVGFLTGGRGQKLRKLPEEERHIQEEEALCSSNSCPYSCPQNVCHLLPLRHEGNNWCCDRNGQPHVRRRPLLAWYHQHAFTWILVRRLSRWWPVSQLAGSHWCTWRHYGAVALPPTALIECVADIAQRHHKVRRLHLVIVDLSRPWTINQIQVRSLKHWLHHREHYDDQPQVRCGPQVVLGGHPTL